MGLFSSSKKITRSMVDKHAASEFGSVRVGGQKLRGAKVKKYIKSKIRYNSGISKTALEDELKQEGVRGAQQAKRKKLLGIFDDSKEELTKEEVKRQAEKKLRNIRASFASSEQADGKTGGVAAQLSGRRANKKGAIGGVLERGGVKTTKSQLNIEDEKYGVAMGQEMQGQKLENRRASVGQNIDGQAAASITSGVGAKKVAGTNLSSQARSGMSSPPTSGRGTRPMGFN